MVSTGRGRTGRTWERVKALVFAEEWQCWLCGQPVDQGLVVNHRMGRTADHLVSLHHGGPECSRDNLRLAHRSCNTARGNRLRNLDQWDCACREGKPCAVLVVGIRSSFVALNVSDV